MRKRRCLTLVLAASLMAVSGCDFSSGNSGGSSGAPGTVDPGDGSTSGGGAATAPILLDTVLTGEGVCPGDEMRLIGINFSSELSDNVVVFSAGATRIAGVPLRVDFPTDGNAANGLESQLTVVIPSGVATGNVELSVSGIPAGARGYTACPQIMAATIGRDRAQEALPYLGPLGFEENRSFIELHGLNFGQIDAITLEDSQGNTAQIPTNTVERTTVTTNIFDPNAPPPTGYTSIGFSLRDDRNDVRLSFPNQRDNLRIQITGPGGESNTIEVPVFNQSQGETVDTAPETLGYVINGIKLPTGVRSGSVRLRYSGYEGVVSAAWVMNVEWKLVSEQDEDAWRPARPDIFDPEHDGSTGILAGTIGHPSGFRLFPGRGTVRTFSWDAANDEGLCELVSGQGLESIRRDVAVHFRFRPTIDIGDPERPEPNHEWISPPLVYYFLEEFDGAELSDSDVERELRESFATDELEDEAETTASWGPPGNVGALVGTVPTGDPVSTFGEGTDHIVLSNLPVEPGILQWFEFNTSRMSIVYNTLDQGDPAVPEDDTFNVNPLTFNNPGESINEYHLASLVIESGVQVIAFGDNPLVIRLSGGEDADPDLNAFVCEGIIDASGNNGESTPVVPVVGPAETGGGGGLGGPGAGHGGNGSTIDIAFGPRVNEVVLAETGGNSGGGGGETTAGLNFDATATSGFWGAAGGGGGHREPGGDGDSQAPRPVEYSPPKAGRGGVARGEATQIVQTSGSGGGGGGGSVSRDSNGGHYGVGGAGGGGGGGSVRIVVNGSVSIPPGGAILALGGDGGTSIGERLIIGMNQTPPTTAGGPGGGGSGGSIRIQATGAVDASCEALNVDGGAAGLSGTATNVDRGRSEQNVLAGAGRGSPGWIRVESQIGGSATCSSFFASALSTSCMRADDAELEVDDVSTFPSSGAIRVTGKVSSTSNSGACRDATDEDHVEDMFYFSIDRASNTLLGVRRGDNGTPIRAIVTGATVALLGPIAPRQDGILSGGEVAASPDPVETGLGRDGELHVRFITSTDPTTGEVLRNESGEALSLWTIDTDTGVVVNPDGDVVLEVRDSSAPGLLDLSRLVIDPNTILRAEGSNALQIVVAGPVEIAGAIDASGFTGGALRFSTADPANPRHGLGGAGGPGGARGGDGGFVLYRNEDVADKSADNTVPVHGQPGGLPPSAPEAWDKTPVPFGSAGGQNDLVVFPGVVRALAGASVRGQDCDSFDNPNPCQETAGGGGGGGNNGIGGDAGIGTSIPVVFPPVDPALPGSGGSSFGTESFRFGGDLWLHGGTGGGGGGAHPQQSNFFKVGILPQSGVVFGGRGNPVRALHAPGTGGGGGGGVIHIRAEDVNILPTGRLLARGGDAVQSIDLGGNGGAGAGGNVIIQVRNSLTFAPGAEINVGGGRANLDPPIDPGQGLPIYEGNRHISDGTLGFYGGVGGNGAPGRIRLEADPDSLAIVGGDNPNFSGGPFLDGVFASRAFSQAIQIGVGPGGAVSAPNIALSGSIVRFHDFGQPLGTDSAVLWEGADESLDQHGQPGPFRQAVTDPRDLRFVEYVRFGAVFLSNVASQSSQSIREIRMQYRYTAGDTVCAP